MPVVSSTPAAMLIVMITDNFTQSYYRYLPPSHPQVITHRGPEQELEGKGSQKLEEMQVEKEIWSPPRLLQTEWETFHHRATPAQLCFRVTGVLYSILLTNPKVFRVFKLKGIRYL